MAIYGATGKGNFTFAFDKTSYQALSGFLDNLAKIGATDEVRKELNKAGDLVINMGKRQLDRSHNKVTGNLSRSFQKRIDMYHLRMQAGFRRGKNGGNHAHLIDSGTVKRWTKKGWYRGSVSKNNPKHGSQFWHQAVERVMPIAATDVLNSLQIYMNRQFASASANANRNVIWSVSNGRITAINMR